MNARRLTFGLPAAFLIILSAAAILAPWIAPYGPGQEHRRQPYHPPTQIHWVDESGQFSLIPFVYETELTFDEFHRRIYREDKSRAYRLAWNGRLFVKAEEDASFYLLGTDARGRDLFSRILYGARVSLSIGVFGACAAAFAGLLIGCLAGYFGGRTDNILMRAAELFMMIPGFYLLLALRSVLPAELGSAYVYFLTVGILSLVGWGGVARVIRGLVLSIRQNDFIPAARVLGRGHGEIMVRHVFPHTFAYLFVVISMSIPSYIWMESALSILGLGIQEPDISWGSLLTDAMSVAHLKLHPWVLYPGLFLFLTAWSCNALGDAVRKEEVFV